MQVPENTETMTLIPGEDSIIGNIGDQQPLLIAEPDRSFKPATTVEKLLQPCIKENQAVKTGIDHLNSGIDKFTPKHTHDFSFQLNDPGGKFLQAASFR